MTCNPCRACGICLGLMVSLWLATPAMGEQELRIWVNTIDPGRDAALRAFTDRNPGWRIISSAYLGGRDAQKLMTAIVGGDPPDVIIQDRFTIGEWASRETFLNLDPFIARSQAADQAGGPDGIDPEEFYPACWNEAVYRGQVYGVPCGTDARALFYNEDALRDAGFVDENGQAVPPRDWEELRRYALALTQWDSRGNMTRLGFAPNYGDSWLYIYGFLNGGSFMSEDGTTVTMNEPRITEALAYMAMLYDDVGGVSQTDAFLGATTGEAFDPFAIGRVAMKIDGSWQLRMLAEYHPSARFRVAPPPAPAGKPSVSWSGGYSYVIPVGTKHPEMSFELIRFLVSDEGWAIQHDVNARYASSRGLAYIPDMTAQPEVNRRVLNERVLTDPNVPPRVAEAMRVMYDLMPVSKYRPVSPVGQLLWDEQVRAAELAVRGRQDPQTVLDRAAATVQHRLDEVLDEQSSGVAVNWTLVVTVAASVTLLVLAIVCYTACRRGVFAHYKRDEMLAGAFFIGPWAFGFLTLTAGPVLMSLVYAFCRYSVIHPAQWNGLDNFSQLFLRDGMFWYSLANTLYMLIAVPLGMVVGLGIALLLNAEVRGVRVYRTIFYLPAIVPLVASSILWIWVLNPENGLINNVLRMLGVSNPPLWLNSPSWLLGSKAAMVLMMLWGAGSGMIIWLAGLKGIPGHLYEAAKIDGAGPVSRFRHVTLPMLTPYIFFNFVMGAIGTMQIFSQAFIMTQGGPADSTMFYAYYLFNHAFRYFRMGYASALAWILLLIILALTAVQMYASKRWVYYESS